MLLALATFVVALLSFGDAHAIALDLTGDLAVQVAADGTFNDPEIGIVTFSAGTGSVLKAGSPIGVDCITGACWLDNPNALDWLESMTIDFGAVGTTLHTVTLSDLDIFGSFADGGVIDTGKSLITFSALDAVNGVLTVNVEQTVQSIRLTTTNVRGASYRLAGIHYGSVTPTPEAEAVVMFASAGLVILLATWRKLANA